MPHGAAGRMIVVPSGLGEGRHQELANGGGSQKRIALVRSSGQLLRFEEAIERNLRGFLEIVHRVEETLAVV